MVWNKNRCQVSSLFWNSNKPIIDTCDFKKAHSKGGIGECPEMSIFMRKNWKQIYKQINKKL